MSYTINKTLFIIEQVQIISPKKFIIVVLDINSKIFMVQMAIQK